MLTAIPVPSRKHEPSSRTQIYPIPHDLVGPPSLYQLCCRTLIKHINEISDVGTSLEYRTVEPILIHVKYARQLRTIEKSSPQVAGHLPELWKAFIARDFNADPGKYVPADPKMWDMVYAKHAKEYEAAQDTATNALREQLTALSNRKEQLKPQLLTGAAEASSLRLVPAPVRSGWGGGGGWGGWGRGNSDGWNTMAGSRTKDVFKRIKREVGDKKRKLTTPTHQLNSRRGTWGQGGLNRAMVEKLRRDAEAETALSAGGVGIKRANTEEDRDRRFQMETSRRLGERTTWRMDPAKPTRAVKPAVITNTSLPLPNKEHIKPPPANASASSLRSSQSVSNLSKSGIRQTPQRPKEAAPTVMTKPQGIRKSPYQSPHRKGTTIVSATGTSTSAQSNSAFLKQLKRLGSSAATTSSPAQLPGEKDELFDETSVEEGQKTSSTVPQAPGQSLVKSRPEGHWSSMGSATNTTHRKLIPIQKPRKEPNLFHIKKPPPSRPPKCTGST